MDTRTLAESYFTAVNKGGWEDFVAENFDYGMCEEVAGRWKRSSGFKSLSLAVATRKSTRIGCCRIFKI